METKVRVGVRVRPLLPNEKAVGSEMVMKYPGEKQIGMGERSFTYDHVFGPTVAQSALYGMTVKPMLQPFLDGYNVTVIAYGQTGSGKTYTMGSEAGEGGLLNGSGDPASSLGLIPRYVDDLFAHLAAHEPQHQQTRVTASFLEIYGEDVYDLLDDSADGRHRPSLPIREDVNAGVMVSGLKQVAVGTRAEALQALRKGTMNRTTAATLMNVVSSRSHAVFTVTLQQVLTPEGGGAGGGKDGDRAGDDDDGSMAGEGQVVVSKLTFVDLAGSERLKRTGAEGERRREGIQINVGLLALGSVINALADEERLIKNKKSTHVPYRQSKLTRLLQDALGGNSQTLFLACVSPADINASETLSTLHYADRARNIRNKPVKNTDSVKEELRCLRQTAHFLKAEMVRQKFIVEEEAGGDGSLSITKDGHNDHELMERADVKAFLDALGAKLDQHLRKVGIEGVDGSALLLKPFAPATPGGNRYSPAPWGTNPTRRVSYFAPSAVAAASRNALPPCSSPPRVAITQGMGTCLDFDAAVGGEAPTLSLPGTAVAAAGAVTHNAAEWLQGVEGDPENELALLEKLRELQQHEAVMGAEAEQGREELATVDGELEQKEGLLGQLRKTLEGYHGMRARYERLLKEVDTVEREKEVLHYQLEQALLAEQQQHAQQQRNKAGAAAAVPAAGAGAAAALREKLKGVEAQLDRLKVQKKQQENLQRLAERQKQELRALEENLGKLKNVRAALMKKQKETSKRHETVIQQKRREMEALRKADRTLQKKVGRLQLENRGHKVLLDRKESCIRTLKDKAAKAETHVLRLLQLQNRNREAVQQRRTTAARRGAGLAASSSSSVSSARKGTAAASGELVVSEQKVEAARFLIGKLVEERLEDLETRRMLEHKTRDYEALVQELRTQAQTLEALKAEGVDGGEQDEEAAEELDEAIREAEARLEGLDVEMELCAASIGEFQSRLESHEHKATDKGGKKASSSSSSCLGLKEEEALKAVAELGSADAKLVLAGLIEGMVEARAKVWALETDVQKKACAEEGLRTEKARLERRVSESARAFEQKVVDLKCQHQQDLMVLVRSGVGASAAGADGSPTDGGISSGDRDDKEKEGEEEGSDDKASQVAKRQLQALVAQNDSLDARCQTLMGDLDQAKAANAQLAREGAAAQKEARELREALEALRTAGVKTEEQQGEGALMEELLAAWADLGISEDRRRGLLGKVSQAPTTVCQGLLDEARKQRAQAKAQVAELREELGVMAHLLGSACGLERDDSGAPSATNGTSEEALALLREELQVRHVQATATLKERLQRVRQLVLEAETLQHSVGGEPRPALADLLALGALLASPVEEDEAEEEGQRVEDRDDNEQQQSLAIIKVLEAAAAVLGRPGRAPILLTEEKLQQWDAEIKAMRRARSALVLELQGQLERGHGACSLMNMSAEALKDTIQRMLEQERQQKEMPPPPSPQRPPVPLSPAGTPRKSSLSRRRQSITPPPSLLSLDSASLHKMVDILTSGGGGATVAGLWAAEDEAVSLTDAIPQARFVVEVLVECWNRRRELLVLCRSTAETLKDCVVGEALEAHARALCEELPEADSAEGEVQNGGLSAEEATAFSAGLATLLAGVEEERGTMSTALDGLWGYFQVPAEARHAGGLRAPDATASEAEQPEDGAAALLDEGTLRSKSGEAAFKRLKADLERTRGNNRTRLEVEGWIGQVLDRMCQQVQALQTNLESLEVLQDQVHVLRERRRRQEAILKLNDEIVGLEGRAKQFETEASDRTRLVDRKTNSARLLKEEKFRKDSKVRFGKLLERLRQELDEWETMEGTPFDRNLLGEDIQRALAHYAESGGRSWVEGRTELMHLHTSQPKSRGSSPNALSPPLLEDPVVAAAAAAPPQPPVVVPSIKRDPFARVLSPTAEATASTSSSPEATMVAATPVVPPTAATLVAAHVGGLLGLNRLMGAGTSVSDLLVRGKHIQPSAPSQPVDQRGSATASSSSTSSSRGGGLATKKKTGAVGSSVVGTGPGTAARKENTRKN